MNAIVPFIEPAQVRQAEEHIPGTTAEGLSPTGRAAAGRRTPCRQGIRDRTKEPKGCLRPA